MSSSNSDNPLKRFPSKSRRLAPFFRSLDTTPKDHNVNEIEKRERWLQMDRLDPSFGVSGTSQEVFIRRSYRRMQSSSLFFPPRNGASLAELSAPPPPDTRRYILVQESRLRELAQIETILKQERDALGEQCSWILSDYHIDARIPVPATRVAVNNLCEADMRRLAGEMDLLKRTWRQYCRQQHYDRDESRGALPKSSYLGNAPLFQRPAKLVLLLEAQDARQLRRERDTMLYEDDESFLTTAFYRAAARKKDYERYFILATRYGHMSESEFNRDERPGRRYWARAIDGCLKFQRVWGAYWAVQSLRRYKGAKQFQKIVRGFLTYRRWHGIIVFRLKYGKSSYLKFALHLWKGYIRILKMCRESIAFFMQNWVAKCLDAWKVYTEDCKELKLAAERASLQRYMNAGLVKTFHALAAFAKRRRFIRLKLKRIFRYPHFDVWCEYVAISKYLKRQFKGAAKFQSIMRMFQIRRRFKAKRVVAFKLGIVMRCRYLVDQLRNAEVRVDYKEWKAATQESRSMILSQAERSRLDTLQQAVVEREKAARKELRRHLKTHHGRAQLRFFPTASMLHSAEYVRETAEKDLLLRCSELHRAMEKHDFCVRFPPAFRCVDPSCSTTFTSEEQYHAHFKNAPNHKTRSQLPKPTPNGSPGAASVSLQNQGSSNLKARKRLSNDEITDMRLQDKEKALALKVQLRQTAYEEEAPLKRAAAEESAARAALVKKELAEKEEAYKQYKASYVLEVKSTKQKVSSLELSTKPTRKQEISELNKAASEKGKQYSSSKVTHTAEVAAMQKQISDTETEASELAEELREFEETFVADKRALDQESLALDAERAEIERQKVAAAEALKERKKKDEADFKATLSYSSLHCLLLHPKELQILRNFLLHLLPPNAILSPPKLAEEESKSSDHQQQQQQEQLIVKEESAGPVIKVKGWVFVKGKGWVMSKKPPSSKMAQLSAPPATPSKGVSAAAARAGLHSSPSPVPLEEEPARDNSLPEVHLLNCLDLWADIQRWKTSALTIDAKFTQDAINIYETFLRVEGNEDVHATSRRAGGRKTAKKGINSLLRKAACCLMLQRRPTVPESNSDGDGGSDGDSDSDSGSEDDDYDSDSSDDEAVKQSKRKARVRRQAQKERDGKPFVRRTVDVRVLDKGWPQREIDAMLSRLETVRDKIGAGKVRKSGRKPHKLAAVTLYHPAEKPLSFARKVLGLPPGTYSRWTDQYVLSPDIFDGLHWALFQYLYEKVHRESGFEKSTDFMQFRMICAQEEDMRERLLFLDAKRARSDRFKRWARDDFVTIHRAEYKFALTCADASLARCVDSLLALAIKVCVGERVKSSVEVEQARHEATSCLSEDITSWVELSLVDEWYDTLVSPYVTTMLGIPDMRGKLMVFAGLREFDAASQLKSRKAFDVRAIKDSSSMLDSFMDDDSTSPAAETTKQDSPAKQEDTSADSSNGANQAEAPKQPMPKLSRAAAALQGLSKDFGLETEAAEAAARKSKPKRLDRATAAKRIQRRVRGNWGRSKARTLFVRAWVKRVDASTSQTYYCNLTTNESFWAAPRIYKKLFPWNRLKPW